MERERERPANIFNLYLQQQLFCSALRIRTKGETQKHINNEQYIIKFLCDTVTSNRYTPMFFI